MATNMVTNNLVLFFCKTSRVSLHRWEQNFIGRKPILESIYDSQLLQENNKHSSISLSCDCGLLCTQNQCLIDQELLAPQPINLRNSNKRNTNKKNIHYSLHVLVCSSWLQLLAQKNLSITATVAPVAKTAKFIYFYLFSRQTPTNKNTQRAPSSTKILLII